MENEDRLSNSSVVLYGECALCGWQFVKESLLAPRPAHECEAKDEFLPTPLT